MADGSEKWMTAITDVKPNRIMARGYPIDELMGRITFAQAIYLILKGELPVARGRPPAGRHLRLVDRPRGVARRPC